MSICNVLRVHFIREGFTVYNSYNIIMIMHVVTTGTEIVSQIFKIFLMDQIPKYFSEENLQILCTHKQNCYYF